MAGKGPTPLFTNIYIYAVNKAASRVLGKSAVVLTRSVSEDLWSCLVSRGLIPPNPSFEDLRKLFVEKLGLAEDLSFEESGEVVAIVLRGLTVSEFLEAATRERFEPVVCPLASILVRACENMSGGKLVLQRFEIVDAGTVRAVCTRVKA
jgi:hypothetical protein|uniref:Uncharacterized protein n=1 Tax=Thermofilum pendens TaxID=2269 RepID=A0A7C3WNK2_THEPE